MRRSPMPSWAPSALAAVLFALGAVPGHAAQAASPSDPPPAITLPAGDLPPEMPAIRAILEGYVKAVEAKDVAKFRAVKPNMSDEEERRARAAFKSVQSQVVRMSVLSVEVHEGKAATVKVARRDTINGSIVSSFPQTFLLAKEAAGWTIQEIGR